MTVVEVEHALVPAVATPGVTAAVPSRRARRLRRPWWYANVALGITLSALAVLAVSRGARASWFDVDSVGWWVVTAVGHVPFLVVSFFLVGGLVERVGYCWRGRQAVRPGRLPGEHPSVCVQLPMFNEHAVARRVIEAASAMTWPADRLSIQVLDDSTDEETRVLVAEVCAAVRASSGVACSVLHRVDRRGYKAGALEAGRRQTDAEFIVIFDADFMPPEDFLVRTIPHFYDADGEPHEGLALVQTQWGHLNHDQSSLTSAQSLWVDDHHTLQMAWRSAKWQFVNFTGTAGVWRASAIEATGGWRAASLVEDCELSFRHLFAGYRTKFVKEIVVPAELPATYTAYKAQQKRWTQGWVQLQRLHLGTLLFRFRCAWPKRLHLLYQMCISWQWPAWAIWTMTMPILIYSGHWFGSSGAAAGLLLYVAPTALWLLLATTLASIETRHTYPDRLTPAVFWRRLRRLGPYLVLNTGMLPHQFSAFAEGLFGSLHSEFERTPKAATVGLARAVPSSPSAGTSRTLRSGVKIHWPHVITEAAFVAYQLAWAIVFICNGLVLCALGAAYLAACVLYVASFYGDHAGKVAFIFDNPGRRHRNRRQRSADGLAA